MTKRVRTLVNLGDLPYTTVEGGKWLKKALDPADIETEIGGIPDTATNPRAILNYQFQGDIPIPNSTTYVASSIQSYDVDFYTFQNPILYGMSVSRPSGTKNMNEGAILLNFDDGTVTIQNDCSPATVKLFLNDQVEGESMNDKLESFERYCQRFRVVYGGVQGIPACSALFDSGTIEATQQIFSPETNSISDETFKNGNSYTSDGKIHMNQIFNPNDFPDNGTSIQNSTSLYCRYKEGVYMPYKLRNPLVYQYKGSEQRCVNMAPFVLTSNVWGITGNAFTKLNFDANEKTFNPQTPINEEYTFFIFEAYSKTGIRFYVVVERANSANIGTITLPEVMPAYNSSTHFNIVPTAATSEPYIVYSRGGLFEFQGGNPPTTEFKTIYNYPFYESNIGLICFRSVGLQASIRVIFRMGVEMMITAGGVYSPFKHKAPKYDQKALNSYVRAAHNLRDAFLGNAATPEGHADYAAHIAAIAMVDEDVSVSNLGSGWYGRVSV